jgi:hypothetical protein
MQCKQGTLQEPSMLPVTAPATAVTARAAGGVHNSSKVARQVAGFKTKICTLRCAAVPGRLTPSRSNMRCSGLAGLSAGYRCFADPALDRESRHACACTALPHGARADLMHFVGGRTSLHACRTCEPPVTLMRQL